MIKRKCLLLSLAMVIIFAYNSSICYAATYTGGSTELQNALMAPGSNIFNANTDTNIGTNVSDNIMQSSDLTINGNGYNFSSIWEDGYSTTISVSPGKRLNIYNAGIATLDSSGYVLSINSAINNIEALNGINGGVINNSGGTVNIYNSVFQNNFAPGLDGGAIYNGLSSTMQVNDSVFYGNYARWGCAHGGGAIYNAGDLTINNSNFTQNLAESGSYDASGGAIFNDTTGTLKINNTVFYQNFSHAKSVGAIANFGQLTIKNSTFDSNYLSDPYDPLKAGAIDNRATGVAIIIDSIFKNNIAAMATATDNYMSAAYGGAIYNTGSLVISGNSFDKNYSINFFPAIATSFLPDYCNGGAIYNESSLDISNSSFTNNSGIDDIANWTPASPSNGGAIYNTGNLSLKNDTFTGNGINSSSLVSATNGGAIYNDSAGSLTIINSTFSGNKVATNGGAIYNAGTLNIIADGGNTSFLNNYNDATLNDIYLNASNLNLNASSGNKITFSSGVDSSNISNIININKSGITENIKTVVNDAVVSSSTTAPTNGTIIFNSIVNNATVNLYSGTLAINSTGIANSNYFNNVNLNLDNGSTLDLRNNVTTDTLSINNFNSAAAYISFDTDLAVGSNDILTIAGAATGSITGKNVNITAEATSDNSSLTLFNGAGSLRGLALNTFQVTTTNYIYTFTQSADGQYSITRVPVFVGSALNQAVANAIDFSATGTTTVNANLGLIGGTTAANEININGNNYNINGAGYSGIVVSSDQTLNITNAGSNIGNTSWNGFDSINGGAIYNGGATTVSNSIFNNNTASTDGGAIYNDGGTVTLIDTSFKNNSAINGGAIYNKNGTINIIANNSDVAFTGNTATLGGDIYLDAGSTLNLNASSGNKITINNGTESVSSSNKININGTSANDSTIIASSPTSGEVVLNSAVSSSTAASTAVALYGGTLTLGNDGYLNGTNLTLAGGTLNIQNNAIGNMSLSSLALAGTTNLKIDANLVDATSDTINLSNISSSATGTGTLNISSINVLSDSTLSSNGKTTTKITDDSTLAKHITLGVSSVNGPAAYSPIYKYNVTYDTNGSLLFSGGPTNNSSSDNFNPAILQSPISANVGAYMGQVNVYNEVLSHSEGIMSMPQSERLLMKYANKYAAIGTGDVQPEVFSPTFLPENNSGLWFKQYTTFENIPLHNGPNVSNVAYGAIIGGDTELVHLKHGFDGYLTLYTAYNGAHQNYDQVGINQNGGSLGITGTLYKGNLFSALTASVGDSYGQANTIYGVDNFNTIMAGLAWKTGYNIELLKDKLIFQPSLLASYTFVKTFDYDTSSGVKITSDPLNAIQIAPGIKLIANMKNGWQPYLGTNMVWNIMDSQKFYANNAQLPQMSIDPYVEYGLGVQRKWGNRFSGFGQAMLRGGGRNGIALQFGFRMAVGK